MAPSWWTRAVQRPEGLYREPRLMASVLACSLVIGVLFFVDIPLLHDLFVEAKV